MKLTKEERKEFLDIKKKHKIKLIEVYFVDGSMERI